MVAARAIVVMDRFISTRLATMAGDLQTKSIMVQGVFTLAEVFDAGDEVRGHRPLLPIAFLALVARINLYAGSFAEIWIAGINPAMTRRKDYGDSAGVHPSAFNFGCAGTYIYQS